MISVVAAAMSTNLAIFLAKLGVFTFTGSKCVSVGLWQTCSCYGFDDTSDAFFLRTYLSNKAWPAVMVLLHGQRPHDDCCTRSALLAEALHSLADTANQASKHPGRPAC